MKRLSIILLVVMISMTSCLMKEKETAKESRPSAFQPEPLDDDWSKSLVGEWEGTVESSVGKGKLRAKIELGLNGQFLIMKCESEMTQISPEQKQYLKKTLHASDEDIAKYKGSTFRNMEIYTIDPKTGEIIGYLFDSMRCIAKGKGNRQGDEEIMEWEWSANGQGTSICITEKVSDNKFIVTQKYTLPDGSIMEDKGQMIRKK